MNLLTLNLVGKPSGWANKTPGKCCIEDVFVVGAAIALNITPDPDEWELTLTLNDGSTVVTSFPASFTATDVTVSAFTRHPDALTNINFKHTIRITLSNGSTFDLNLLPLLGSTANTLFVTANGDDTLAAATDGGHNRHATWANPTVAMAAASAGDTVIVYPGEYKIGIGGLVDNGAQHMVKDKVILDMIPGAIIHYTNATGVIGTTVSLPFTDAGAGAKFTIRGNGQFIFARGLVDPADRFLVTTNENSVVDWEFDKINIKLPWGGTGHNCISWRMKGREYVQSESAVFEFAYSGTTTNRLLNWNIEKVEIRSDSAVELEWDRFSIASVTSGTIVNLKFGEITYPHAKENGALFYAFGLIGDIEVNIHVDKVTRTGIDSIRDYLYKELVDRSKGIVTFNNIETRTSLIAIGSDGSSPLVRKTFNLQGVILPGSTLAGTQLFYLLNQARDIQVNLDIDCQVSTAAYIGMETSLAASSRISGILKWHSTFNEAIVLGSGVNAFFKDLTISDRSGAAKASMINLIAGIPADVRIQNCYATSAVSAANGGINQMIETIKIDANV